MPRQKRLYLSCAAVSAPDRKSTRLNSSHLGISYAVFCLKNISAAFWFVAAVIGVHVITILSAVAQCAISGQQCQTHDSLRDLLTESMDAAHASSRFCTSN